MLNQIFLQQQQQQQQQQQHNQHENGFLPQQQDMDAPLFPAHAANNHNPGLLHSSTPFNPDSDLSELSKCFPAPYNTALVSCNNNSFFSNDSHHVATQSSIVQECVAQAAFLTQSQDFSGTNEQEHNLITEDGSDASTENRFRHYQADAWTSMLEELLEFRRTYGHCNVPHTSKELPALGRWVKRQRYQYKLMQEGKKESTMTPERAQVLEQVGFVWDAHGSTWHRRFQQLHAFFLMQGHCNVPSSFPANPQLSTWVKFQRRQYKALCNGKQPKSGGANGQSLTPVRIRALEELGFQWELRKSRSA
jgi:hypothetical protein